VTVHNTGSSRLWWSIGIWPLALGFLAAAMYELVWQHDVSGLLGLVMFGPLALAAYYLGGPATLTVDDLGIVYGRPVGGASRCPKGDIAWIDRVVGFRGAQTIKFKRDDGTVAVNVDHSFKREDMEAFAGRLGVPLNWRG
jgi:hypothetical protein